MKQTANPYKSNVVGDDSMSEDRIMKRGEVIARKWINPNRPPKPEEISKWLNKVPKQWSNVYVTTAVEENEDNLDEDYIVLIGDRLETNAERDERLNIIVLQWQKDYEDFLRKTMFYKSEMGKAQIREIKRKKLGGIWNGYPESTPEFKKELASERRKYES